MLCIIHLKNGMVARILSCASAVAIPFSINTLVSFSVVVIKYPKKQHKGEKVYYFIRLTIQGYGHH